MFFSFPVTIGGDYFTEVESTLQPVQKEAHWNGVIQPDSMWAFADQGSYKMSLRKIKNNYEEVLNLAQELKTIVNEKFSDEVLYELFCDQFLENSDTFDDDEVIEII